MVIKVYVAMISCSQEIKKNQQRAVMILESKNIPYTVIDITDPACEDSKDYMVETAKPKEGAKIPVTPQIFNEADYCGDYDGLDMANECDTLGDFLKLSEEEKKSIKIGITGIIPKDKKDNTESHITNGVSTSREGSPSKTPSSIVEPEKPSQEPPVENSVSKEETVAAAPPPPPPPAESTPEAKEPEEVKEVVNEVKAPATESPKVESKVEDPKPKPVVEEESSEEESSEEESSEEDSEEE